MNILIADWNAMFVPAVGLFEIVLRGTIMYLVLFAILRFLGRRQAGHFGPSRLVGHSIDSRRRTERAWR